MREMLDDDALSTTESSCERDDFLMTAASGSLNDLKMMFEKDEKLLNRVDSDGFSALMIAAGKKMY